MLLKQLKYLLAHCFLFSCKEFCLLIVKLCFADAAKGIVIEQLFCLLKEQVIVAALFCRVERVSPALVVMGRNAPGAIKLFGSAG